MVRWHFIYIISCNAGRKFGTHEAMIVKFQCSIVTLNIFGVVSITTCFHNTRARQEEAGGAGETVGDCQEEFYTAGGQADRGQAAPQTGPRQPPVSVGSHFICQHHTNLTCYRCH